MSQATFARLASAMMRAVKRKADETDSDESVDLVTNRGNKLRKRARYVREGKLAPPSGPEVYKRTITHAGYEREIISRRPTLYDDDGFEIDSDDEDEGAQAAIAAAAQFYPYSQIRIEDLLAPLTRPADLAEHPTLSRPFVSKPLTELTRQAREMVQKEKATLWRMKHLLTLISGDHTWVPCEMLESAEDINLFSDGRFGYPDQVSERERTKESDLVIDDPGLAQKAKATPYLASEGGTGAPVPTEASDNAQADDPTADDDVAMIDVSKEKTVHESEVVATGEAEGGIDAGSPVSREAIAYRSPPDSDKRGAVPVGDGPIEGENVIDEAGSDLVAGGATEVSQPDTSPEEPTVAPEGMQASVVEEDEPSQDVEDIPEPRRMRTRAQAQAASDQTSASIPRSTTPSSNTSYVHPYFIAPASAHPHSDLGLPPVEAEETRRLLQLYIQKQEEVCRGAQKVYDGLLKAERLRKTVLKWCKADGHLGELSDGEDWYDLEEWGLTEELKKGQEEEEEDAATTAKKTRTRRQ